MFVAAATIGVGSCSSYTSEGGNKIITVSIEPQRWILERIVGDKFEVNTILSVGADPENFEPSLSDMKKLEQSLCVFTISNFGFEKAITDRVKSNSTSLNIINSSEDIDFIVNHNHEHCTHGHEHGVDPHVWNSAINAKIVAQNMLQAIISIDSANSDFYNENYKRLTHHIDSIDCICKTILSRHQGKSFLVWHPSLSYFARDYSLNQLAVGVEGKELSMTDTKRIVNNLKSVSDVAFLVENDADKGRSQIIAADVPSIRIETINPLNYEWDFELIKTAKAIAGE